MGQQLQQSPKSPRLWQYFALLPLVPVLVAPLCGAARDRAGLDYSQCLFGRSKTLQVRVARIDRERGIIECTGVDTARPRKPFTWDWADGQRSTGFFPQTHSYKNRRRSYVVKVMSHYPSGKSDTAEVLVCFGPRSAPLKRARLPGHVSVVVPSKKPRLRPVRAPYRVSRTLTVFDDSFFQAYTRETVEYVLTVAAAVQLDLANNDVCRKDGRFDQVLLRDPKFKGMYSLWYTDPVCFGVGDYGFKGDIEWSSFFHEMGHNVTLNSPAKFHWGLKQDGPANTIYSETMAQIFQHATAYELVNNRQKYGISDDLAFEIARNARASMYVVRRSYENYRKMGSRFCSWNDGRTRHDDTFNTFMTIAYKFFEHAEKDRRGYQQPVKRLMAFMQRFNPKWQRSFSARRNSPQAERFRATLASAALSHAFRRDLRPELRKLRFPIDDGVFRELMASGTAERATTAPVEKQPKALTGKQALILSFEGEQRLPDFKITGRPARIHSQGLFVTKRHYYVTGRLETNPRWAVFVRFERKDPRRVEYVDVTQKVASGGSELRLDHAGGFDFDGHDFWIPISASRPNSHTVVLRFPHDPDKPLADQHGKVAFRFNDHIGAIAVDRSAGELYGANWDTRITYRWKRDGTVVEKIPRTGLVKGNPGWALAVQDWKGLDEHRILAGGIDKSNSRTPNVSQAVIALLDPRSRAVLSLVRLARPKSSKHVVTHEGLARFGDQLFLLPDDLGDGARIFRYRWRQKTRSGD